MHADSTVWKISICLLTFDYTKYKLQDIYKDLGPMTLCGVLHVTYQTPGQTTGYFMVCVLFNSYLLLARGAEDVRRLEVVACIYLGDLKEETIQNGQGTQPSAVAVYVQVSNLIP